MSKFTPAPWNACHEGECKCGSVFGGDGNVWVAQVYGPHHQGDGIEGPDCVPLRESQIANAKLIQAAPLMYEALRKFTVGYMDAPGDVKLEDNPLGDEYDQALAALAAAGGESLC